MFRIKFDRNERMTVGDAAVGSIIIGSFREVFESPLHIWRQEDYEEHWHQAVRRLVDGSTSTALITALYDPASANFINWWPAFRFGREVRFHNQLLLMADLGAPFELSDIYRHVPLYEQTTAGGDRISEWSVPLADLESFVGGSGEVS